MSDRLCSVCNQKPLRIDNASGICHQCAKAGKTIRECRCGCGRRVTVWSVTGYALPCWRSLLRQGRAPSTPSNTA